jgi:uncharacterized protein YqeY
MNKYESIKAEMTAALKNGDKLRRLTLADMVATIDKAATSGKTRVEITDALVDEVMTKYKKTVQEMVDTCPNTDKYADRKAEYLAKLEIAKEFAPIVIDDVDEIRKMINLWGITNAVSITSGNKGVIMKAIMPWLKQNHCDMKAAQEALKLAMFEGDACIAAQMGERG